MSVRFNRITARFPGKSFRSRRRPRNTPSTDAMSVDQNDMMTVTRMESSAPMVPKNSENKSLIPSIPKTCPFLF